MKINLVFLTSSLLMMTIKISKATPVLNSSLLLSEHDMGYTEPPCPKPFIDLPDQKCGYRAKSKLAAFLVSFLAGGLGIDWFYLSDGDAGYIIAGIVKLITGGGLGIWWLVDWIRILADGFPDGNAMALFMDM